MQVPLVRNVYNVHLLEVFGISWLVDSDIHKIESNPYYHRILYLN
jgi:hypothetical protein